MGSRFSCHKTHPSSAFLIFHVCCALWLCNCTFFPPGMVSCFPWLRSPSAWRDRRETDVMPVKLIPSCPGFPFLSLHGRGQVLCSRLETFSSVCPYLPRPSDGWPLLTLSSTDLCSMGVKSMLRLQSHRNLMGPALGFNDRNRLLLYLRPGSMKNIMMWCENDETSSKTETNVWL